MLYSTAHLHQVFQNIFPGLWKWLDIDNTYCYQEIPAKGTDSNNKLYSNITTLKGNSYFLPPWQYYQSTKNNKISPRSHNFGYLVRFQLLLSSVIEHSKSEQPFDLVTMLHTLNVWMLSMQKVLNTPRLACLSFQHLIKLGNSSSIYR